MPAGKKKSKGHYFIINKEQAPNKGEKEKRKKDKKKKKKPLKIGYLVTTPLDLEKLLIVPSVHNRSFRGGGWWRNEETLEAFVQKSGTLQRCPLA